MKLIKPSFEIIKQQAGLEGVYKQIERAGRVSYKSEHNIKEGSAKDFVDRMIKLGHGATLEFGTVYLVIPCEFNGNQYNESWKESKYNNNPYSKVRREYVESERNYVDFITTNLRVLVENNWLDDLKYLCEPTEYHYKRYTVKYICDRAIANEIVRHRKFSFLQESTRYCNYSKGKFNGELTFIQPIWTYHQEDGDYGTLGNSKRKNVSNKDGVFFDFIKYLQYAEHYYLTLVKQGWKAEEARNILPLCLKTELYMCGFAEDWEHFFKLRCATNAHPQARELAIPLKEEFIKRNYI